MVHQILLLSENLDEVKRIYNICKNNQFVFYFFDSVEVFFNFLIHERIDVAIINGNLMNDPLGFISEIQNKSIDTSFIYIGERDPDTIRTILKNGYYDYLYYDYKEEDMERAIVGAIDNKRMYENIKMISSNLEKINRELSDKAKELRMDKVRLKEIINRFRLIETFIREISLISELDLILSRLVDYVSREFKSNKIIATRIDGYTEYVVSSYGIESNILKDYKWDLKDIKASPWAESILNGKVRVEVVNPLNNIWYANSSISNIFPEGFIKYPIFYENDVYGTIVISCNEGDCYFPEDKIFFLKQILEHASIQIYNKKLQSKLSKTIEQLKDYQQQLIEKEKLSTLAKVAVSVNHEINNPLCAISLNAEIIKRRYKDDENLQKIVDAILNNVILINKITNKFASLKKVTFKEYLPGIEMLDLGD
ncbi:histidine kinase dimerization/phospho-acceptor domain-containing protein [Calditerrivibrio nitroreducens]|uniref:GAF domain-containing protein n=1 Tax=Calditerrivibrio nitroreducens TaxID=477976 RepID=UPI003C786339